MTKRSSEYVDPDKASNPRRLTNMGKLMKKPLLTQYIIAGVTLRSKFADGKLQQTAGTMSNPYSWSYNINRDRAAAFLADPWLAYHNNMGAAWFTDGQVKSYDGRALVKQSWYRGAYEVTKTALPMDDPKEIYLNYGNAFNWLDGKK